jgi:hypothetical protein
MTGAEHYRQAERLLANCTTKNGAVYDENAVVLAAAQVHATLALAAATALGTAGQYGVDQPHWTQWADIVRPAPGGEQP